MSTKQFIKLSILLLVWATFIGSVNLTQAADYAQTPVTETGEYDDGLLNDKDLYRMKGEGYEKAPLRSDGGVAIIQPGVSLVSLDAQSSKSETAVWVERWPWIMVVISIVSLLGYLWNARQGILARWR